MFYYDDLSAGSSDVGDSSEGEWSSDDGDVLADSNSTTNSGAHQLDQIWDRCILHLDVDCFYCQCEEIDRNLGDMKPPRPLAIGQKHIIVTSNYEARKYGVKKLQSRDSAYLACPDLWIVEGSDLFYYRRHSRSIYECFRKALQEIARDIFPNEEPPPLSTFVPAKKGCMDEMMADLTHIVKRILQTKKDTSHSKDKKLDLFGEAVDPEQQDFVFGDNAASSVAVLVEDQTGQKSVVSFQPPSHSYGVTGRTGREADMTIAASRQNIHSSFGNERDRLECIRRLEVASQLTARVCRYIRKETGFHTTGGVSVSPLLAKLASGLNKPKSVNLLYPWRSSQLLHSMPLRKMHNVGYKTMKVLEESMTLADSVDPTSQTKDMRTVRDLLEMPRESIRQSLQNVATFQSSSEDQCELLIQRCRGLDNTEIVDDEGAAPKTLSIENSFRRGTVRTMDAVAKALEDLFERLPKLLRDRTSWSIEPERAFPTTIRLTVRIVDSRLALTKKRRPYVTRSKQASLDGRRLLQESDLSKQSAFLKQQVSSLVSQIMPVEINVTRMNIALTNFQDIVNPSPTINYPSLTHTLKRLHTQESEDSNYNLSGGKRAKADSYSQEATKRTHSSLSQGRPRRVSPVVKSSAQGSARMKATRIDHFFKKP